MDEVCGSKFWDWNITWYTENPDFTPCFKNTVLVWIPCAFLWIFSPLQIYNQRKSESRDISFNGCNIVKLVLIIVAGALQFTNVIQKYVVGDLEPKVNFYSPIIMAMSHILFFILTLGNLKMGIRWSGISFTFSLLSIICGIPNLCTAVSKWDPIAFYDEDNTKQLSYILYYLTMMIIFVLNCLDDEKPQRSLCLTAKYTYPDERESLLSKIFMFWFDPYLWGSYKKPIDNYLWNLRPKDAASEIQSVKETSAGEPISIVRELFKKFGPSFWYCLFLKTTYEIVTTWINVVFYFLILVFEGKQQIWKGYLYCALFGVVLIIQIVWLSLYQKNSVRLDIQVKSAVSSTLYSKALRISNGARRDYTTSDIVNLLSVDANKVQSIIPEFHHLFGLICQIIVSFFYLWYILGPSTVVNIFVIMVILWVSYYASVYMKKLQQIEMKNKDIRGKFMQEIFAGIKVLKMYAWEPSFRKVAANLRHVENKTLKKIGAINTIFQVIFVNSPFVLCLCGYASFTFFNVNNVLDVTTAFISMSIFNSFRVPFQCIPSLFLSMQQFLISAERINKFLNTEELDDNTISHEPKAETLIMEDATFFWNNAEGHPILENLNVKIKGGSLVAIVGPVGAGKSSLISAFLGEMYKISGYVNTNGTIAYVPQQAWILNTTVKQNITVDETIDPDLYKKAIEACALQPDLEELPAGDLTEIGEKGVNLSGGQKQRVSLARAVCRNADIYFFDDPLSAVDSHVSNHIFSKVLGPNGILNDKTRVLITHSTKYLSYMDQIIVLKNGRISENGTYEELMNKSGEFAQLLQSNLGKTDNETEDDESEPEDKKETVTNDDNISKKSKSPSPKNSLRRRKQKKAEIKPLSNKLIEGEQIKTKEISMKLYWTYICAAGVLFSAITILLFTIYQTISIFASIWLSSWISNNDNNSSDRYFYLLIYASFGVGQSIAIILANIALYYCTITASTSFYDRLLNNVLRWPMSSFDSTPIGRIINRFGDDVYVLDNVIGFKIAISFVLITRYVSIILLVACIIPSSIILIIPTFIIYFLIKKFFVGFFHQLKRIESVHRSPLYSHVVESVAGVQSIRAYGFQRKFISQFKEKCDHCSASYYATSVCLRWLDCRCAMIGAILICFITILCIKELDTLSIAKLTMLMTYALQLSRGLNFTLVNITLVEDSIISVERINEYIKYPQEPSWEKSSLNVPKNWPTGGEVIFHKYQLRYRDGLDLVLKGLTFKIQSGEKVGIVGRTGAGKSSIILGLFRIVEPADGTILIDNVDITTIGLHKLRSKLTVIPQDPVLFSGTLSFNLDPFGEYPDEYLWDILEKSHLKNFVKSLPGGLCYNIEEGGRNLSFGQRQLICLARALLRKSKILVLDEATASVDMKTDELIQKTIRNEFPDSTVITIAHRLNTLQDYDKILILDGGRMVDFDTTENLLKSENSRLREMVLDAEFKN